MKRRALPFALGVAILAASTAACGALIGLDDSFLEGLEGGPDATVESSPGADGNVPGSPDAHDSASSDGGVDAPSVLDGDVDAPSGVDGGVDGGVDAGSDASTCTGYLCLGQCVQPGDPAYGCSEDAGCTACAGRQSATSTCAGGACAITCAAQHLDCDGQVSTGCEVSAQTDPLHCGSCTTACSGATPFCVNGTCTSNCAAPKSLCGSTCVDVMTSVTDCGTCNHACPAPANGNGTASCVGGNCMYTCGAGYADCDGNLGCEVFLASDPAHCGSCTKACAPAVASGTCVSGQCDHGPCTAPYQDCNSSRADGCETPTGSDVNHCGGCDACPERDNTNPIGTGCVGGVCQYECFFGYTDCNGDTTDGCECGGSNMGCIEGSCQVCAGSSQACGPTAGGTPCCEGQLCCNGQCQDENITCILM